MISSHLQRILKDFEEDLTSPKLRIISITKKINAGAQKLIFVLGSAETVLSRNGESLADRMVRTLQIHI